MSEWFKIGVSHFSILRHGVVRSYSIPLTGGYDLNGNLLKVADSVMGTWNYG